MRRVVLLALLGVAGHGCGGGGVERVAGATTTEPRPERSVKAVPTAPLAPATAVREPAAADAGVSAPEPATPDADAPAAASDAAPFVEPDPQRVRRARAAVRRARAALARARRPPGRSPEMAQARLLSAAARLDAEVARLCELLCPGARPDEIDAALVLPDLAADLLSVARQVRPPGRCDPRSPDFESCDDWEWQSHADWSGEVESFEQARRAANVPGLIARCGRTDPDLVLEPAAPASSPAPAATPSVSPAPAAPPVPPSGLRSIDWASRSYAFAARSYASEQRERREIELRGGRAQQTIQSSSGADTLTTVLFEVKYADLFGDDREEAVVVLSATMPTAAFTWAAGYLLVFAPGPAGEPLLVDTVRAPPPGRVRLVGPGVVEVSARPGVDLSPHPCVERLRATDAGWQPVLRRCGR